MSQSPPRHEITRKPVLYAIPGMDAVTMRRDVEYLITAAGPLTMDLYYPPDAAGSVRLPAVVFVTGYSDPGLQAFLGCKLKDWESYICWGKLTAASGLIAVIYSAAEPAADLPALLRRLREDAASLGIDPARIGLWACSGNGPMALGLLMQDHALHCAVLCYAYTLDLDGATHVADAARTFSFANPCAGKSVADLPPRTPLFLVRAGQDQTAHLNQTMDRFLLQALGRNLPVTCANHPDAPHAFDLFDPSEASREMIRQMLEFLRSRLTASSAATPRS